MTLIKEIDNKIDLQISQEKKLSDSFWNKSLNSLIIKKLHNTEVRGRGENRGVNNKVWFFFVYCCVPFGYGFYVLLCLLCFDSL